jgi:hypothetical protein
MLLSRIITGAFLITLLLFISLPTSASADFYNDAQNVNVTARVPLSPQHVLGIKKNSYIKSNTNSKRLSHLYDTVTFTVHLKGLLDKPLANKAIVLTLQAQEFSKELSYYSHTNGNGEAVFTVPITYALNDTTYHTTFSTIVENVEIDLLNSSTINIFHFTFSTQSTANNATAKIFSFPQENSTQIAYSTAPIFATLEQVKKIYGFTDKKIKTPAAFGAAARDGPVVFV